MTSGELESLAHAENPALKTAVIVSRDLATVMCGNRI